MKKLLLHRCCASSGSDCASVVCPAPSTQAPGPAFPLTVDSIMRGPELVGNPPNNLRWSGDSKELYFEWRMPKDDSRDVGRRPRRRRAAAADATPSGACAPLANGQWDATRRRILGVDRGDIVIIDTVARKRIDVTRTTGNESSPRWARGETHVTFVRDNNLFIVPVESVAAGSAGAADRRVRAARRSARRPTARSSSRKKKRSCSTGSRRKRRAASGAKRSIARARCRSSSWPSDRPSPMPRCRPTASSHSWWSNDRAQSRTSQVPRFVSESAFTEEINARTKVGDAQDRRRLAVLNLETGEGVWAGLDGVSDPIAIPKPPLTATSRGPAREAATRRRSATCAGASPLLSPDGRIAVASVRAADNTERWLATIDPANGHDEGARSRQGRCVGARRRAGLAARQQARVVPRRARRLDASLHRGRHGTRPARKQLTTGKFEIDSVELSPDGTHVLHPVDRSSIPASAICMR